MGYTIRYLNNSHYDIMMDLQNQRRHNTIKIYMTPITALAHFEENGTPHPRFKLNDNEIKIQVLSMTEEKLAGNKMLCFRCQSEIGGALKQFEIKYKLGTCRCFCGRCSHFPRNHHIMTYIKY